MSSTDPGQLVQGGGLDVDLLGERVEPGGGGHQQDAGEQAHRAEERGDLGPVGRGRGRGLVRSGEHGDQLGLQAGGKAPAARFGVGDGLQVVDQPGQRQPLVAVGRQVEAADLVDPAVPPPEEPPGLADRVDHVGDLERLGEEVPVDEQVVARQEDAEIGVGVIPADDVEVGVQLVALAGDLLPRVVRISEAGLGVLVVLGLQRTA